MITVENEVQQFLLKSIVNAAIRGGAAVMEVYMMSSDAIEFSLKSDKSPITEADRRAHTTIKEYLGSTRIPILSEEGREMLYAERCNWELFWLIDPLDGTVEFINRTDEFTINIALMSENKAIASVVYVPCLKRLFFAAKGMGAYLCEDVEPDSQADFCYEGILTKFTQLPLEGDARDMQVVAISRSHNSPETFEHIESLKARNPSFEVVQQGSSYKFCMLAEGRVDYYVRTSNTYEWDTAAGELVLSEAGGSTLTLSDNEPLLYNKEELDNPWFVCRGPRCTIV